MRRALVAFTGTVDGAEVRFLPGDEISEAAALEMGLDGKSDLVARIIKGKAVNDAAA